MAYPPHDNGCFLVADCSRSGGVLLVEEVSPGAGKAYDRLQQIWWTQFFRHGRWRILEAVVADFGAIIAFGCGGVLVL